MLTETLHVPRICNALFFSQETHDRSIKNWEMQPSFHQKAKIWWLPANQLLVCNFYIKIFLNPFISAVLLKVDDFGWYILERKARAESSTFYRN